MDDGSERSADVPAIAMQAKPDWRTATPAQPLYRQRLGESFWYAWMPDSGTVYVSFRKYDDLRNKSQDLWSFVDSHPAKKIAIDFREIAHATLVGETIGERPNSYSENDEMRLPGSQIQVSYSTMFYKFLPGDGLVTPDKEIEPTWADWVAGRDPVLDWIVKQ